MKISSQKSNVGLIEKLENIFYWFEYSFCFDFKIILIKAKSFCKILRKLKEFLLPLPSIVSYFDINFIDNFLFILLYDFMAWNLELWLFSVFIVKSLWELFLDILLEVPHPILIQILYISFGLIFSFEIPLMGWFKIFGASVDVKTAEYFAKSINYNGVIMYEMGGTLLDSVKIQFFMMMLLFVLLVIQILLMILLLWSLCVLLSHIRHHLIYKITMEKSIFR